MSVGQDLYGFFRRRNPTAEDLMNAIDLLRNDLQNEPPKYTREHWARLEQDLAKKIRHSEKHQSSRIMAGGAHKGEKNPNYAKNRARFDAQRSLQGGGGSGFLYVMTATQGAAQKGPKTPGARRGELRRLERIETEFITIRAQAVAKGRIP